MARFGGAFADEKPRSKKTSEGGEPPKGGGGEGPPPRSLPGIPFNPNNPHVPPGFRGSPANEPDTGNVIEHHFEPKPDLYPAANDNTGPDAPVEHIYKDPTENYEPKYPEGYDPAPHGGTDFNIKPADIDAGATSKTAPFVIAALPAIVKTVQGQYEATKPDWMNDTSGTRGAETPTELPGSSGTEGAETETPLASQQDAPEGITQAEGTTDTSWPTSDFQGGGDDSGGGGYTVDTGGNSEVDSGGGDFNWDVGGGSGGGGHTGDIYEVEMN